MVGQLVTVDETTATFVTVCVMVAVVVGVTVLVLVMVLALPVVTVLGIGELGKKPKSNRRKEYVHSACGCLSARSRGCASNESEVRSNV